MPYFLSRQTRLKVSSAQEEKMTKHPRVIWVIPSNIDLCRNSVTPVFKSIVSRQFLQNMNKKLIFVWGVGPLSCRSESAMMVGLGIWNKEIFYIPSTPLAHDIHQQGHQGHRFHDSSRWPRGFLRKCWSSCRWHKQYREGWYSSIDTHIDPPPPPPPSAASQFDAGKPCNQLIMLWCFDGASHLEINVVENKQESAWLARGTGGRF